MLTIVRSPVPGIQLEPTGWPAEVSDLLQRLIQQPQKCQWIVPTSRRRRALLHDWLRSAERSACLLPGLHTLESFVSHALEYSPKQRARISGPEVLLRLSRAWHEVTGRAAGPGLVRQLARFVRDWQACHLETPGVAPPTPTLPHKGGGSSVPRGPFESVVHHYLQGLERDGRLDRMGSVQTLTAEVVDPESWPNRLFLDVQALVLLDGFHLLEKVELELVAALSHRCDVLIWLVGMPGRVEWPTLESSTAFLTKQGAKPRLVDHIPDAATERRGDTATDNSLFALGRSLFPIEPADSPRRRVAASPIRRVADSLFKLEANGPRAEVEAIAQRIKADYRQAESSSRPLRLSDVAVVIPGPAYDPLIREVFPRAGLEFNLAGRALLVSTSRPARVLTAAFEVIRGQWRHDRLLDFLNQPLVKRLLVDAHRLTYLFEHRSHARQRLDHQAWFNHWKQHLDKLGSQIERWRSGESPVPEGMSIPQEQYLAQQSDLRESVQRLLGSIEAVLQPVSALEASLEPPTAPRVTPAAPLRKIVAACVHLLEALEIDKWLTPPGSDAATRRHGDAATERTVGDRGDTATTGGDAIVEESVADSPRRRVSDSQPAVPWVEYEKDQNAYYKLLASLKTLTEVPEKGLPDGLREARETLQALELALSGETYQIRTEDDAGVQVFELREIRGLRFRHVYVLGLVDGQMPALPEEGMLVQRRRRNPALARQLEQKEAEAAYLFCQLFEAARERLVLSRPVRESGTETDVQTLPSRFLTAVEECAALPGLEPVALLTSPREAARRLGRSCGAPWVTTMHLPEAAAALKSWQERAGLGWPERNPVSAAVLLHLLFPDAHTFSPSELETYAACPFRYFGRHVLRLAEPDHDRSRMHYGSLLHRVLQRFYLERRRELSSPEGQPLPPLDPGQRQRLLELFKAEWAQLDPGTVPPDLAKLFEHDQGVLQLFFETMKILEADHGNLLNEFMLRDDQGNPILLGTDSRQRPVYVTGKIDRVDVDRQTRRRAIVLDYKTGWAAKAKELKTKMEDGRMLQLPLYAAALTRLRNDLEVVGAAYVHLSEKTDKPKHALALAGDWLRNGDRPHDVPLEIERSRAKAIELVDRIRAGDFSLTDHVLGTPHAECTFFCPMRHACRQPNGYKPRYSF